MKREEFVEAVKGLVYVYINNEDMLGKDAQIRVNPVLLTVDIETADQFHQSLADSEEAIENAAYAYGGENEEATDYQASQNPDFYPIRTLLKSVSGQKDEPDTEAIECLADNYF